MGKKGKKQKALEEKRRQEEELLRQQQEEERLRQEELERQRQEEEGRQRQLREKRRQEEVVRLEQEREDDKPNIVKYIEDLERLEMEEQERIDWKKHLRCEDRPDVFQNKDLNDFLTVWKESTTFEYRELSKNPLDEIVSVVTSCNEAYSLKKSIFERYLHSLERQDTPDTETCMDYMKTIVESTTTKLDELTLRCLRHDSFTVVGSGEVDVDEMNRGVSFENGLEFGLWSSGMRNAFRNKKVQINDMTVEIELPKQVAMKAQMPLACRVVGVNDLVQFENRGLFEPISKIYDIRLLPLARHPDVIQVASSDATKTDGGDGVSTWRVQRESSEMTEVTTWDYGQNETVDEKNREEIRVVIKLPEKLVYEMENFGEEESSIQKQPQPGWWSREKKAWCDTDFADVSFDESANELSFVTRHLRPLSVVIPRAADCNYKSWVLSPTGVERCKLTLCGGRFDVEIEIVGGECQLLQPNIPQLMDVIHQQMKPHELVAVLSTFGVRVFPNDLDVEILSGQDKSCKDRELEMKAYREISTSAASFEVSNSKWNGDVGSGMVVFKMRKPLTPNEEADMDSSRMNWMICMISDEKCSFVECKEDGDGFVEDPPPHESSHTTLLRCLAPHSTEDFSRDLAHTSFRFQRTVRDVLTLTRPLFK